MEPNIFCSLQRNCRTWQFVFELKVETRRTWSHLSSKAYTHTHRSIQHLSAEQHSSFLKREQERCNRQTHCEIEIRFAIKRCNRDRCNMYLYIEREASSLNRNYIRYYCTCLYNLYPHTSTYNIRVSVSSESLCCRDLRCKHAPTLSQFAMARNLFSDYATCRSFPNQTGQPCIRIAVFASVYV